MEPNLNFQKVLTLIFVIGYFCLVGAFIALLFFAKAVPFPTTETLETLSWAKGVLGTLIGIMTAELPKQLHFWSGSSLGSKMKDAK